MDSNENILGVHDDRADDRDDNPTTLGTSASNTLGTFRTGQYAVKHKTLPTVLTEEEEKRKEERRIARKDEIAAQRKKICVGIDFGTTYSGIAFVSSSTERHPKTHKDIEVVTTWLGGQNDLLEKVPSRIAYASENNFDEDLWGYDVKPGTMVCCQWFKLLLDSAEQTTKFNDPLLAKYIDEGLLEFPKHKSPLDVVTDFLRMLYEHTIGQLKSMMGAVAVDETPIIFELTLPATWSHAARNATRQAALDAGFKRNKRDSLSVVDEPESAAIAAMKSTLEAFPESKAFKKDSSVLICDLGGGTSDCVTYKIVKTHPVLALQEACVGEGGKCGSTSIDRAFWEFLEEKFGDSYTSLPRKKRASGSQLMCAFEDIKRDFRGSHVENKAYEVPLKMKVKLEASDHLLEYYDDEEDMVKFTSQDLEKMFAPTLKLIFRLVKDQVKRTKRAWMPPIETIVLCGGFGSSAYVKYRFQQYIAETLDGKAEVITPKRPWSAIARGACIRALEKPSVLFRLARDHIGIMLHEPFDVKKHRQEDRFECPKKGARARNQMRWSIKRGDEIKPNMKKVMNDLYVDVEYAYPTEDLIVYQDFFVCKEEDGPTRFDQETCIKAGRIKMDLTKIAKEEYKKLQKDPDTDPDEMMSIDIKIELKCGGDKGVLEAAAKVKLRCIGNCEIVWDADPEAGISTLRRRE